MNHLNFKKEKFTSSEIHSVASLHKEGIEAGFLSSLGENFLQKLYGSIAQSKDGILILAIKDQRVVGFVSGALSKGPILASLIKDGFNILPLLVSSQNFSIRSVKKMSDLLLYSLNPKKSAERTRSAELLSLAVDKNYRDQGIAQSLYGQLFCAFASRGVKDFKIVVGNSLTGALKFYEKMGARKHGELELHKGEKSSVYVHDVNPPVKPAQDSPGAGYAERFNELFHKLGQRSVLLDGVLWTSYQKMVVPVGPANLDYVRPTEKFQHELLNYFTDCILIRSGSGFVSSPEEWYSVISDQFYDLPELSMKSRAQARRGLRKCTVRRIDARFLAEHGWPVFAAAYERYKDAKLSETESDFQRRISATEGYEDIIHYWGVFEAETGKLIGFSENYIFDKTEVNYWTISFHPDYLRLNCSHALLYEMNKFYLGEEKFAYANNGFRNLLHQTGIQDYLINKFLYKKQPVGLKMFYRPWVGKSMAISYPVRKVLGIYPPLRALYKLEEIRRLSEGRQHVQPKRSGQPHGKPVRDDSLGSRRRKLSMTGFLIWIKHRCPWIWSKIEQVNCGLLSALWGRRIEEARAKMATKNISSGYFRLLTVADAGQVADLLTRLEKEEINFFNPHKFDLKTISEVLGSKRYLAFGFFVQEKLAGYFFLRLFFVKKAFLGRYLVKEYRNSGVGTEMLNFLCDSGHLLGFRLFSTVHKENLPCINSHRSAGRSAVVKELPKNYLLIRLE